MERLPFVPVIVPVYNGEATIEGCIRSLLEWHYPKKRYEILVVDSNSTDNTSTIVKKYPVRYLVEDEIQNPCAARNRGIREARGEILAFTDADVVVGRNRLMRALDCFQGRELFEDVGLFEERLFSSGDYEFGRRATGRGRSLVYCRDAKVWHRARSSLGALLKKSRQLGYGRAQLDISGGWPCGQLPEPKRRVSAHGGKTDGERDHPHL